MDINKKTVNVAKDLILFGFIISQINTLFRNRLEDDKSIDKYARFASGVTLTTIFLNINYYNNSSVQNFTTIVDLLLGLYSVKFYSEKKRYNDVYIEIFGVALGILLYIFSN
jgi:hypothetical protein